MKKKNLCVVMVFHAIIRMSGRDNHSVWNSRETTEKKKEIKKQKSFNKIKHMFPFVDGMLMPIARQAY